MRLYRTFKTIIVFYFSISYVCSLKPSKLPSGKDRIYKYNRKNPESDLKKITPMEASFISRHWLNNIVQPKQICEEDELIVKNINTLEQSIQEYFTGSRETVLEYLAWMPRGVTEDILFLVVLESYENKNILRLLINSPSWESKQINVDCLLESLKSFSSVQNKNLELQSFLSDNIRYQLMWRNFKTDPF